MYENKDDTYVPFPFYSIVSHINVRCNQGKMICTKFSTFDKTNKKAVCQPASHFELQLRPYLDQWQTIRVEESTIPNKTFEWMLSHMPVCSVKSHMRQLGLLHMHFYGSNTAWKYQTGLSWEYAEKKIILARALVFRFDAIPAYHIHSTKRILVHSHTTQQNWIKLE